MLSCTITENHKVSQERFDKSDSDFKKGHELVSRVKGDAHFSTLALNHVGVEVGTFLIGKEWADSILGIRYYGSLLYVATDNSYISSGRSCDDFILYHDFRNGSFMKFPCKVEGLVDNSVYVNSDVAEDHSFTGGALQTVVNGLQSIQGNRSQAQDFRVSREIRVGHSYLIPAPVANESIVSSIRQYLGQEECDPIQGSYGGLTPNANGKTWVEIEGLISNLPERLVSPNR